MRSMRWALTGVVLVLVSCGGGSSKSSDTTEVVSSGTTEVVSEKLVEDVIFSWYWDPGKSLEAFRTLNIPVIKYWYDHTGIVSMAGGRRLCDDVHTLADLAAGVDRIQPDVEKSIVYANYVDTPLLAGKLGVTVEFVILKESTGGPSQLITNYDRFQATHQLPCKGKWPVFDDKDFQTCSIPQVPGFNVDCFNQLKSDYSRTTETDFAFKSDFKTLAGEAPIVSAISTSTDGYNKWVELERIVYLPLIDRSVLLTVTLFDESQSFKQNELMSPASDIAIAIWSDIEADLTFCITTSGC